MSRRRRPEKRVILPDPKFGDITLSKFMNSVMLDGKKSVAESIVYGALETVEARLKKDPLGVFHEAERSVELSRRRPGSSCFDRPDHYWTPAYAGERKGRKRNYLCPVVVAQRSASSFPIPSSGTSLCRNS